MLREVGSNFIPKGPYLFSRRQAGFSVEKPALIGENVTACTGFEPVISALRGRRPRPLDEQAV